MLQIIREHAQGWVMRAIIGLIVIAFTFWGINGYFSGGGSAATVATVNGVQITKEQLAVAYERLRRQVQIQYGANQIITAKDESALKLRALQTLTEIEALKQASQQQEFIISDRQIDNYLENMPEFQVDGRFSTARFQEILASTLLSTSDFFELIRTSLLIDQPRLGVLFTSFAAPEETRYTISLVNQDREFSYVTFPAALFQSRLAAVSDAQVKQYYDAHKALFMTPEQVSVEYVELSLKNIADSMSPPEEALKAAYNENVNSYTAPAAWLVTGIEIPVAAESSADVWNKAMQEAESIATKLSDDSAFQQYQKKYPLPKVVSNDFLPLAQFPEAWQKSIASLQKKGQVSAPIKSSAGIVILKVRDLRPASIQSFDAVRDKVKQTYVRQRAEERFAAIRDQLSELTYQHPDSLKVASEKLELPLLSTELFSKDSVGTGVSSHKKVRDVAFSDDVMVMKNNSDLITLNAETAIVLRLKTHQKSSLLSLESVKKQIIDKIRAQMLDQSAAALVKGDVQQLQTGSLSEQLLATKYKLEWKAPGFLGRYSNKVNSVILDLVFSLPRPAQQKPVYGMTKLRDGSYVIVALKQVKDGMLPDEKELTVFSEQVQNSEGLLEYELLKRSLLTHAKIEILENQ